MEKSPMITQNDQKGAIVAGNEFFTLEALGTFGGATAATLVISGSVQSLLQIDPRWLAIGVAEIICVAVALLKAAGIMDRLPRMLFVAIINGFLVFSAATGLNGMGASLSAKSQTNVSGVAAAPAATPETRSFWSSWF